MIYLRTGLPGAGKTLRSIAECMKLVDDGREVYALNVRDLDHDATGIKPAPFDHLENWRDLPAGSVLLVDEVQRFLPPMGSNSSPPDWIEALTRNRHHGVDLHLVTQHPKLINHYVRELVNYHEHLTRLEGNFNRARVYYGEGVLDVNKRGVPRHASFKLWRYPSDIFAVYTSADTHTVERYTPQRLKIAALGAVALVAGIAIAIASMGSIVKDVEEPIKSEPIHFEMPPLPQTTFNTGRESGLDRPVLTSSDFAVLHTPVVDGVPWSSPLYADLRPAGVPEIYCMIGARLGCRCYTEQATRVSVKKATCESIAKDGLYNPFKQSREARGATDGERGALLSAH